jgi:Putative binding domain, N-terminal
MTGRTNRLQLWIVAAAMAASACGESPSPTSPEPIPATPGATVSGGSYAGTIVKPDGTSTSINVTLIARSLASTAESVAAAQAQASGTTEVSGNYKLGTGATGTVQGLLEGTLQNGEFQGTLNSDVPACSRAYAGPITESSLSWLPSGDLQSGCPLDFLLQITRAQGPECNYPVSFDNQSFSGNGGSGKISVATGPNCSWLVESLAPWIQITGSSSLTGPGAVAFKILSNPGSSRQGQVRVASETFGISQGPACTYAVSPTSATVGKSGGSASVTLTTPETCEWTAQSNVEWITLAATSGKGGGKIGYTVQANSGPKRQGTITVAGKTVTVTQETGTCNFAVTPSTAAVPTAGGNGTIELTTAEGCGWTAESSVPWITLAVTSGSGPRSIGFTAEANSGLPREGTVTIAGERVTITQGTGCSSSFQVIPTATDVLASGGSGDISVIGGGGCQWTAKSNVDWITLSTSNGTGNGTVTFTAMANAGPQREGTLTIAGKTVTITQNSGCGYAVLVSPNSFTRAGGSGQLTINVGAGCPWTAVSNAPWITLSGSAGKGTGTVSFRVEPNIDPDREGTLTVAGQTVTITQSGCTYDFSASSVSFPEGPASLSGTLTVTTAEGCPWNAQIDTPQPETWLIFSATKSEQTQGTGSAEVAYMLTSNTSNCAGARSGKIIATGGSVLKEFLISQAKSSTCIK